MLAIRVTFPAGRYHATPWGRHVNEADLEWPPSPWRIARGLIATWHRKLDHALFPEAVLAGLLGHLASQAPSYRLPPAAHSHTRHYMPTREGKTSKPKLIFDAFARVSRGDAVTIVWPSLDLEPEYIGLLDAALEAIGYLGRAESWIEARRVPDCRDEMNCEPGKRMVDPGTGEVIGEAINLLAPATPDHYRNFRADYLARGGLGKNRVGETLPDSWLAAVSLDTSELQRAGWSAPPAATRVQYVRPTDALRPSARPAVRQPLHRHVTAVRFAIYGRPLPLLTDAVRVGEWFRAAAMGKGKMLFGESGLPSVLSGHDLPEGNRHAHAFWLPEDADRDGRIDHLVVFARAGLDASARRILASLDRVRARDGRMLTVLYEGEGDEESLSEGSRLLGRAAVWRSATPYLHPWHVKKRFGIEAQVQRECEERGLPSPTIREYLQTVEVATGLQRRALQFHRFRAKRKLTQPDSQGRFLTLVFPAAIRGPLALGFGCHFGLGLFVPVSTE